MIVFILDNIREHSPTSAFDYGSLLFHTRPEIIFLLPHMGLICRTDNNFPAKWGQCNLRRAPKHHRGKVAFNSIGGSRGFWELHVRNYPACTHTHQTIFLSAAPQCHVYTFVCIFSIHLAETNKNIARGAGCGVCVGPPGAAEWAAIRIL